MMPFTADLFRALGTLCEPPHPAHQRIAAALGLPGQGDAASHTELFVLQLVPYASVYLGADGMLGGEAADRIAGFWRALRLAPPREPDHLATLLGLYAALWQHEYDEADPARAVLWLEARRALLWEHLLTWVPPYATAAQRTASGFYLAWAEMLNDALHAESAMLTPPPTPPLHLRDLPDLPATADGLEDLVRALLTPARSGVILTRRDLARAARDTGIGLRLGERAFVLRSMLSQDPAGTMEWLAGEAERWATRHRRAEPALGAVARHWRARAEATGQLLRHEQQTALEVAHVR